jgi:hypothetical protein
VDRLWAEHLAPLLGRLGARPQLRERLGDADAAAAPPVTGPAGGIHTPRGDV